MKVLVVEPLIHPYEKEIDGDLHSLQEEVGGSTQAIYPFEDTVGIICNEEGKLEGLPLNRGLKDENGKVYDVLAGTFLIVGLTEDNFCSLTEKQIETYSKMFYEAEIWLCN